MNFAVIPAGGRSVRMGRPKLLLPIGGEPLIARVVSALRTGGVDRVVVVAPPPEIEGAEAVARLAENAGAEVVVADRPTPDMRASLELGLNYLRPSAGPRDGLWIAPADSPGLTARLVALLLSRRKAGPDRILVPVVDGRKGHPLVLPWPLAETIPDLPDGVGVNAITSTRENLLTFVPTPDFEILADLDTPEDYARWLTDPHAEKSPAATDNPRA